MSREITTLAVPSAPAPADLGVGSMPAMAEAFADLLASRVLALQAQQQAADARTVTEALREVDRLFLQTPRRLKPKTVRQYRGALRHVERSIGHVRICDLTHEHANALWGALPERSIASYGGGIRSMLRQAEKLGFRGIASFLDKLPDPGQTARRNVKVTDEIYREALRALKWAHKHTATRTTMLHLLEVAIRVPFRQNELASLRVDAVNLQDQVAELADSKTGARVVPLTLAARDILQRQISALPPGSEFVWPGRGRGHFTPEACGRAWSRIRRAYASANPERRDAQDLLKVRYHDLRHFICTIALRHGAPQAAVQGALGHSDLTMQRRYAHLINRDAQDAVQVAEGVLEGRARRRHKFS